MLYGNAQLARVYLHAWQVTRNEFFRTIAQEILDRVVREMTCVDAGIDTQQFRRASKLHSNASDHATCMQMLCLQHLPRSSSGAGTAGFYSTQDADSGGEEGKFFVWTADEMRAVLGSDKDEFMAAYGVTRHGNTSTGSAHALRARTSSNS